MPPSVLHCIEWDVFLPFGNGNFASQDYRMKQPQKILAYAKALQFWVKKAQLPWAGQPHQLAAYMKEPRESMELLTLLTDKEVLTKELSSNWVRLTPSQLSELAECETMWEQIKSRCWRACTWGSFPVTCSMGCSKPTVTPTVNTSTISSQWVEHHWGALLHKGGCHHPVLQRKLDP